MSDKTAIEWADSTWNPVTGCTKVSPGCDNCYAETFSERFRGTPGHYFEGGFDIQFRPDKLDQPLRWKKPRRIFVNSMSDLFHNDIPDEYIAKVWAVMGLARHHTFQVLTKRHGRMQALLSSPSFPELIAKCNPIWPEGFSLALPLPNVWLGVSTEDQKWADIRVPALLDTPAAVRFISAEPLLGPIDLRDHLPHFTDLGSPPSLDWVIVGGESGHNARPMHPAWATSLRDQCATAEVPFLFKQWGEWGPCAPYDQASGVYDFRHGRGISLDGTLCMPGERQGNAREGLAIIFRAGKKSTGRVLDGRTWDGYPGDAA